LGRAVFLADLCAVKWPLLLLLACVPAWAYPPIFQADVPDPEAVTCLYENSTAGHVEQFPVTVSTERGKAEYAYRVCLRSALDWPAGPNSIRLAVRRTDGATSEYSTEVIPRPSGSVSSARLNRSVSTPPPPPPPSRTMAADPFSGAGALAAPWEKYLTSSGVFAQSGGSISPDTRFQSIGYRYAGAASGDSQYSRIRIAGSLGTSTDDVFWTVSVNVTGSGGTRSLYQGSIARNAWYISKVLSGSSDDKATGGGSHSGAVTPFDLEIRATPSGGNVLVELLKDGSLLGSWTDTTSVLSGGQPGVEVYWNDTGPFIAYVTEWEGGNLGGGGSASRVPRSPAARLLAILLPNF
jgi:hypothetical protein